MGNQWTTIRDISNALGMSGGHCVAPVVGEKRVHHLNHLNPLSPISDEEEVMNRIRESNYDINEMAKNNAHNLDFLREQLPEDKHIEIGEANPPSLENTAYIVVNSPEPYKTRAGRF